MKRKIITIALLSIMIALSLCSVGSAFADEINIAYDSYISEGFSQDEIDFALANLEYKLERSLPKLIRVEPVYNFNDEPLYGLYEFDDYYMMTVRNTGSVLERGEGNSAYFDNSIDKKYYGGYSEYYIKTISGYKNLITAEFVNESKINQMQSRMEEMIALDYQDYLEALSTPMPLGSENRSRVTKLGKDVANLIEYLYGNKDHLYNYFAQEINIDYLMNNNLSEITYNTFNEVLYTKENSREEYGTVYWRNIGADIGYDGYDLGYDLLYPQNRYNQCSIVAMTILLQYYYRTCLNISLIEPIEPDIIDSKGLIPLMPLSAPAEILRSELAKYVNVLSVGSSSVDGAATYVNIDAGFDRYFKENGVDCESVHFTSYTNIKAAIDGGHPSIMTIGAGMGYDIDSGVKGEDVSRHNVVVYGYTTNSSGVIDEFVCHAGYHAQAKYSYDSSGNRVKETPSTAQLFINKFYAAGNVHLSY